MSNRPASNIIKAIRTGDVAREIESLLRSGRTLAIGASSVGPVRLATGETHYELFPGANMPPAFACRDVDPWLVAWKFTSTFGWRKAQQAVRRAELKEAA